MTQTKILPIFPLDLVLFPRQELPLRIFEPRYKQLVDDCMLGDGQFGVCLIDANKLISGWTAPKSIGTIAKITKCKDVELDGMQLHIETVGRNKFKINKIIPPSLVQPSNYDPYTVQGHQNISELHEKLGTEEKMYIRAEVELISEIDENVPLDQVLEKYYLTTDVPAIDYIYSLSALGAKDPNELQPILEANTMDDLIQKVQELLTVK